jgi:hypothetical protein
MPVKKDRIASKKGKEIYILKVFRRGNTPEECFVGTVEDVIGKKKGTFKTGEELLRWLIKVRE